MHLCVEILISKKSLELLKPTNTNLKNYPSIVTVSIHIYVCLVKMIHLLKDMKEVVINVSLNKSLTKPSSLPQLNNTHFNETIC